MNSKFIIFLFIVFGLSLSQSQAQQNNVQKYPTDSWTTVGPPKGTLMIIGGSVLPATSSYFLDLVGGKDEPIVYIPTAGPVTDERAKAYISLKEAGATNVIILHTRDWEEANSEAFAAPLRTAKAVFISGGHPDSLANAYENTLTHRLLFDVLDRGGVIAGNSAGSIIQASFLYMYWGREKNKSGFGLVKNATIAPHYIRANRMGSLAKSLKNRTDLFGIGMDEGTQVVVRGNELEVVGDGKVALYNPSRSDWPGDYPELYLFHGDKYDLSSHRVLYEANPSPKDLWAGAGKKQWVDPSKDWKTAGPPQGKVLLYGSKKHDETSLKHFLQSVKDTKAPIVVLSTGDDEMRTENEKVVRNLERLGAPQVTLLHSISSDWSNSHSFAEALTDAAAVWICDSRSWQLADAYRYTLIHKELFGVLQRNGVVGGNGAGAAMIASRMFGEPERYRWREAYGLVKNTLVFEDGFRSKSASDVQEILKKEPELLAIGLTQGAQLSIEVNQFKVEGTGTVTLYKNDWENPVVLTAGEKDIYKLSTF